MTATSGRRLFGLYGRYSPVGSLARTLLASSRWYSPAVSLRWDVKPLCSERLTEKEYSFGNGTPSRKSAEVLNVKDIPSNRFLFRLVPSERHTAGTACGLLPTVQTQGLKVCNQKGQTVFMPIELLPTPTSIDSGSGRINKSPSPNAKERPTIALAAKEGLLPTPRANKVNDVNLNSEKMAGRRKGNLEEAVAKMAVNGLLPPPNAIEGEKYTTKYNPDSQNGKGLTAMAVNGMITDSPPSDGGTFQLNPLFVTEMMGFPTDWLVSPFLDGGPKP